MSGSEQELKKQRQQEILRNMANEAEVYQQNVSNIVNPAIEDLDQLDRSQELREQVKDMLLTDVRAAGALEEVYPDLVEEARSKEAKLQAQANAGTIEKIKTRDFFGSKKRAAKTKLRTLKQNKDTLKRDREQKLFKHIKEKTEEVKLQIQKIGGSEELVKEKSRNTDGSYYDSVATLIALSDRTKVKDRLTEEFKQQKIYYRYDDSTEPEPYTSNNMVRDCAIITTPFMQENLANLETLNKFQESYRILKEGKVVTKQGRPDATREQKLEAFNYINEIVRNKLASLKRFQEKNPHLFKDDARPEDLIDHLPEIIAGTNNQQISELSRDVIKSARELGMSEEIIDELKEQRAGIASYARYFGPLHQFAKRCSVAADSGKAQDYNYDAAPQSFRKICEQAREEAKQL